MRTPLEIQTAFSPATDFRSDEPFYLVGIGGAGMSSLAFMLQKRGIPVAGSDSTESPTTAGLRNKGIPVRIGHSGEGIHTGHQVVLSDAIDLKTSPEVEAARHLGCKLFRRSQLLNWLLKGKKIIAVTGTHGKTTVTGMIGAGLRAAGMDPTIVVGAYVPEFGGSVMEGSGEYAVVEACEAYNALLDFEPQLAVLTNLEADHLDFHKDYAGLKATVLDFLSKLPKDGCLFYCEDDSGAAEVGAQYSGEGVPYRIDHYGSMLELDDSIIIANPEQKGEHGYRNATAAMMVAERVGADMPKAIRGILQFSGAERRQQWLIRAGNPSDGIDVIDDYAHHPTEIETTLKGIRSHWFNFLPGRKRLIVVFQPHLYSRTTDFIPEFAKVLSLADVVFLTDIYPAREDPIPGVSSARIAELIDKPVHYVPSRHLLPREVARFARTGDVVVGMGAGNISEFAPAFIEELKRLRSGMPANREAGKDAWFPLKIAVIYGGDSAEREVSILSGQAVVQALRNRGHEAFLYDVSDALLGKGELKELIGPNRPDLAFLATHGSNQEDGALQGLLELLHIPYTGSGIRASAIAFDKNRAKEVLEASGLAVPRGVLVQSPDDLVPFEPPLIVKPNSQGSTVGLSFVNERAELKDAIRKSLQYDSHALVEERVLGMEISVPVLVDRALPPVEICPRSGEYDFANKYTPGATEEIVPARLPEDVLEKAKAMALQAHRALGCEGATRTDFIVRDNRDPIVLEVNTLPGLTSTSLLPNSARAAGINFDDLVEEIAQDAIRRYAQKT